MQQDGEHQRRNSSKCRSLYQTSSPGSRRNGGARNGVWKDGNTNTQNEGTAFNVTVNAVDSNWNLVSGVGDTVAITSSDANAILPSNAALSGEPRLSAYVKTIGNQTVTASDATDGTKTANTSTAIPVNAAAFASFRSWFR